MSALKLPSSGGRNISQITVVLISYVLGTSDPVSYGGTVRSYFYKVVSQIRDSEEINSLLVNVLCYRRLDIECIVVKLTV
jgi:hypothetical protein